MDNQDQSQSSAPPPVSEGEETNVSTPVTGDQFSVKQTNEPVTEEVSESVPGGETAPLSGETEEPASQPSVGFPKEGSEPSLPITEQASAPSPEAPPPPSEVIMPSFKEESKFVSFKKFIPLILGLFFLIIFGALLVKVVSSRIGGSKEVILTYWGLWEPENVMGEVLTDWNKAHPKIKINYSRQSPTEYRERLQSALARGDSPDLFRFHISWIPMLKNELSAVPSEVMGNSQFESSFYPVVKENLKSGSGYLGIPLEVDTLALFYNQDIFQAAGKTPPPSWDELRKTAIELTTKDDSGRIQTAGAALGATNNVDHWSDILGLMMIQNGANLGKPTGSLAEDALTFYTLFSRVDKVWDETMPNSTLAFATGKVAMYFGFSWDVFEIKNINPELNFRIVSTPQLPGTNLAWASFWVEGVAKKSKHPKEAWEFLKFLSLKTNMEKLYNAESKIRLFGEPYSRIEMAGLISSNPLVAPFINQAPQAKTWYICSRTFDNGINDRMIKYFGDAVNAVNNGQSPAEALKTASQGVSQLLSQYGLGSYTVH